MSLIVAKCPSCGANLEIDNSRDYMFCQFCGTKIVDQVQKIEINGAVSIDRKNEMSNLLIRANQFFKSNDFQNALNYYNKVLDIDALNEEANKRIKRINSILNKKVITIENDANINIRISINGKTGTIHKLSTGGFDIGIGNYQLIARTLFSATHIDIRITSPYDRLFFKCTETNEKISLTQYHYS